VDFPSLLKVCRPSSIRRSLLLLTGFLCLSSAHAAQPNIIVMVADDLGWNDVGFHGGDIDTPALDRLAAEGVELHRFYTTPICSPTRAALMTGRDPIKLGVAYGVISPWDNIGVHPEEHFMPESFMAAGYQTAMVGKWHLGHAQMSYHPNQRGFEHFYGHLHTQVGFYPPFANMGGRDFQRNGVTINDQGYETFLLADEVSRYIRERDRSKPFFVYMPFIAPHTPLDAPVELQEKYQNINTDLAPARTVQTDMTRARAKQMGVPSARPMYAAVVDGMDQAIAQVLKTLDDEQIAEQTIVFFMSDNGGAAYSYGGADNAPLRGGKSETYEGGIRVVSLLRWPGRVEAGSRFESIMTVMDLFPTLAEAAGVKLGNQKPMDGGSLWQPIVQNKPAPRDEWVFFTSETPIYGEFNIAAFNDQWKLVQRIEQNQLQTEVTNYLFDIKKDPYEYHNLAEQYPQVVAEIAAAVVDWRAQYPINGTRSKLAPPPGWRAPLDWASYPRPMEQLQENYAPSYVPNPAIERALDKQHGDRGRLIYD